MHRNRQQEREVLVGLAETLANVDCDDLIDAIAEHIGIPRTPRTLKALAAVGGVA